jgi:hypothetical protein
MTNHVPLNNKMHAGITVSTKYGAKFGDNISNTLTVPTEFIEVQKEYPILFSKNPNTGEFQSVVLFGLAKDENLLLKRGKWNANYIPAVIAKGPFLIGHEDQIVDGKTVSNTIVCIDTDSPRVKANDGELLFLEDGSNSPYLDKISRYLGVIDDGLRMSKAMFSAFEEHDLIEPVTLNIELDNAEKISIGGNFTINSEKLAQLKGKALESLNKSGFLHLAFAVVTSLSNVKKLVDLKNESLKS